MKEKFVPHKYQVTSIKFGIQRAAAGFFLAPGLGKTMIILSILQILLKKKFVRGAFIVAKRRIIYRTWPREIQRWGLPLTFSIVHGSESKRIAAMQKDADIYLTNFENVEWVKKNWKYFKRKPDMLCIDESSKMKSPKSGRFKALKKMLNKFTRRYIMTGSPAPQSLMDLWAQAFILDGGNALGPYITAFRNRYFLPSGYMGYEWTLQEGAEEEIYDALAPLVLRFGDDELDMPKLSFIPRYVDLSEDVRAFYDELEKEFIAEWQGGVITAANAAVSTGKLQQVANGGIYVHDLSLDNKKLVNGVPSVKKTRKTIHLHDEKTEELVDLVEELNGASVLIAYNFQHDLERIRGAFPDIEHIGSGVSDKKADELMDRFNDGSLQLLAGHPDSIAHGLNLQSEARYVIWYSLTWNLENYEQFIRRIWRQGQKRNVIVYQIIATGTVDEAILAALSRKDDVQQRVLTALQERYGALKNVKAKSSKRRTARKGK